MIAIIGNRLNYIFFDNIIKQKDILYPICVEFNEDKEELIICTRKDIRFYDA